MGTISLTEVECIDVATLLESLYVSREHSQITGSTILVTGGTGSFGHEVVKHLLPLNPKQVIIASRDELKQHTMRSVFDDDRLEYVLCDVRDSERVRWVFSQYSVDYVFHAAALKQVPSCEFFPLEAVKTNVLGAGNVLDAALDSGVRRVVVLSTDKAVYPINAMGMSKALMEKVMTSRALVLAKRGSTDQSVCAVRYGNVLCTRGSVVPVFLEYMKTGKPLPVTNLSMTRFMLPLPDAVKLVLYALEHGANGYTYVRTSEAATMEVVAKALCSLYDYDPGYVELGIRPGEKIHETLVATEEMTRSKHDGDYICVQPESGDRRFEAYFEPRPGEMHVSTQPYTSQNTDQIGVRTVKNLLQTCIADMLE